MTNIAVTGEYLNGYAAIYREQVQVSPCYSDDALVMSFGDRTTSNLKNILLLFKVVSGLRINLKKCEITLVGDANNMEGLAEVVHPIHDQVFYLTAYHKKKLKQEFGIEPWTFVQKLGEAVLIPAGCPHQVRNLKSCIKVALDFVSPENVDECIRLTEEFRVLPQKHRAKEDKLEVKKMALYALEKAVADLKDLECNNGIQVQQPHSSTEQSCSN
ncbi:hypothetical protein HAX54_005052 [Datura stramonium]|uniref:JmjC domain-containing protein n=1 Tax=Datura stramonium TaxID=4076 RepID=A0ABS8WW99_DATST|nr:hypothetical protein [Datura stramonium]